MAEIQRDGAVASAHCPRKISVTKAPQQYKVKMDTGSRKGRVNQVVSLMPLGGVIELIGVWNQDGSDDGFDPFLKRSVRDLLTFASRSGLFCLADRRAPPGAPFDYLPSPQKQRKQNGDPFARHWYMRLVNPEKNEDSVEVRKKIAHSICHVSWWIVRLLAMFASAATAAADANLLTSACFRVYSSSRKTKKRSASSEKNDSVSEEERILAI